MTGSNLRVVDTKAQAKAKVVEMAREILTMAEQGQIVDFAWCASKVDGSVITSFTPTEDQHRRLASVSRLLYRLHECCEED